MEKVSKTEKKEFAEVIGLLLHIQTASTSGLCLEELFYRQDIVDRLERLSVIPRSGTPRPVATGLKHNIGMHGVI